MGRRAWVICALLALQPCAGRAQLDEQRIVREYSKTLAKDKDAKDRAAAAVFFSEFATQHTRAAGPRVRRTSRRSMSPETGQSETTGDL